LQSWPRLRLGLLDDGSVGDKQAAKELGNLLCVHDDEGKVTFLRRCMRRLAAILLKRSAPIRAPSAGEWAAAAGWMRAEKSLRSKEEFTQ
jgi:hypothetical protein